MVNQQISREKQGFAVGPIGGPTIVIDYGGVRLVTDPTLDPPAPAPGRPYAKLEGPALDGAALGRADAVLLSHDEHGDNLDPAGRAYALEAERIITGPGAAARLGPPAVGLERWQTTEVPRPDGATITITALPAVHGPLDGERDADGNVNCEVTGFLLTGDGLPVVYVSGDNASIAAVAEIAAHGGAIDVAILFAGGARVPGKERGRPLTLTAPRAADAAVLLGAPTVVPAHYRGWSHYSEGAAELAAAFDDAGIAERLAVGEPGIWTIGPAGP
ncbi:MAG TPA: MBL fold metallo-hydrolase [Solirubrobacteraceae bacterium]|nr:MBL fold metallo-hydrolase [Solirubrobacteraceae bacterium]